MLCCCGSSQHCVSTSIETASAASAVASCPDSTRTLLMSAVGNIKVPKEGAVVKFGIKLTNGYRTVAQNRFLVFALVGQTAKTLDCGSAGTTDATDSIHPAVQLTADVAAAAVITCIIGVEVSSAHASAGVMGAFNITAKLASDATGTALGDAYYLDSVVHMDSVVVNTGGVLTTPGSEVVETVHTFYTGELIHHAESGTHCHSYMWLHMRD